MLNKWNSGQIPSTKQCIGWGIGEDHYKCLTMKDITNTSLCKSSRSTMVVFNSRCFDCNGKHQSFIKRTNPKAFMNSRALKRGQQQHNNRPLEEINRKKVCMEIHQVITEAGGDVSNGNGGKCVYCH